MLLAEMTNKTIKMREHLYMKYQGIASKPKEFFERKSTNLKSQHLQESRSWSGQPVRTSRSELMLQRTLDLGPHPRRADPV